LSNLSIKILSESYVFLKKKMVFKKKYNKKLISFLKIKIKNRKFIKMKPISMKMMRRMNNKKFR